MHTVVILLFTSYINDPLLSYFHQFYLGFHVFRSDNWLIHVSWVIHYPIMNINCVDFCGGRHCRTQLLIRSPERVSGINHQTLAGENAQNQKSNKSPDFLLFAEVCVSRCWTSDFYYTSMYFASSGHTASPPPLSLSLSLLSPHWHHPSREKQCGFISALTMMHEPDGKHFSGVVIIKPFFSPVGPMWKKYKDKAQSVIL